MKLRYETYQVSDDHLLLMVTVTLMVLGIQL